MTEPEPVLAFLDSQKSIVGHGLPVEPILARAGERLVADMARTGTFRLRCHVGLLVCR
ncbi:MAG: hypothetical protein WCA46_18700 [Actinocatenispora sp.]